MVQDIE